MKRRVDKRLRKKKIKKRRIKVHGKKNSHDKSMDLQKIMGFKFQTFSKVYKNFTEKRKKEKIKQEKLKSRDREKQIIKEQRE